MSQETYEVLKSMNSSYIETQLALQCSPLITGIKISNLLIIPTEYVKELKHILKRTKFSYYILLNNDKKTTLLLFDKDRIQSYLKIGKVRELLREMGYEKQDLLSILLRLRVNYKSYKENGGAFPHELGLLLGYPVEDVVGFIENRGQNSLYHGYWKVYDRPQVKMKLFKRYSDSTSEVVNLLSKGVNIIDIIMGYSRKEYLLKEIVM